MSSSVSCVDAVPWPVQVCTAFVPFGTTVRQTRLSAFCIEAGISLPRTANVAPVLIADLAIFAAYFQLQEMKGFGNAATLAKSAVSRRSALVCRRPAMRSTASSTQLKSSGASV